MNIFIFIAIIFLSLILTYWPDFFVIICKLLKKYILILFLFIAVISVLIWYHYSTKLIAHSIYLEIKLLVNIVEVIGIVSIILATIKYKSFRKRTKLEHTMAIMKGIQQDILPTSSQNKWDLEIEQSEKICSKRLMDKTFYIAMKNIGDCKPLVLSNKLKEKIAKSLKTKIRDRVITYEHYKIIYDAELRVTNEILLRLYRWTIYMNKGFTDDNFIRKKLKKNVKNFLEDKPYCYYLKKADGNNGMIQEIKEIWKIK